jgi:hypothetical protein
MSRDTGILPRPAALLSTEEGASIRRLRRLVDERLPESAGYVAPAFPRWKWRRLLMTAKSVGPLLTIASLVVMQCI